MHAPPSGELETAFHTYSRNDGLAANVGSIYLRLNKSAAFLGVKKAAHSIVLAP